MGLSTPGQRGGPRRTVFTEYIRSQLHSLIDDNLTTTVEEIKRALGVNVSETTVWKWMKQEGFTYKLTRPIYQRRNDADVKASRVEYIRWYTSTSPIFRYRNVVFIDESPFNLHMFRSHSWARRGVTPNPIVRPRGRNVTILAINSVNIIHCEAITTSVNADIFREFLLEIKRILGRDEQYILVMDNVNFHHSQEILSDENFFFGSYPHIPRF
ncbi:hypothetical protein RF11_02592 [Thelohanellus kitauei]|uniref:Tc1-like transposase DDE domain-containing protein n=1 Tax=Thelohanellus kitauei TaxID=669202 RepID=A0A0C2MIR1_THEKT|nr:hypothetical protein RF11_02592 [Thelohanellus kitauei]